MLIDTAIERLLGIRGRTIKSHHCLPGTDEKLLELLVLRCQLQLVGGYVDSAVAMLQASIFDQE
jgi:hypothetical protein